MQMLDEKDWVEIAIEDVFSVESGKRLTNAAKTEGDRPFVGATDNNNGVTGFVGNTNASLDRNVLGVNYNGAPCIAFYHPYECVFTDDVKRLHLKNHDDNVLVLLFMKTIVMQQRVKYSYGHKFKEKRMLRQKLMLPIDAAGNPDYDYMEQYARAMHESLLARYRTYMEQRIAEIGKPVDIAALNEKNWVAIDAFGEYAPLYIGTTNSSIDCVRLKDGNDSSIPYITRSDVNNGIARFVSEKNFEFGFDEAGCITVGLDTQTAFWQPSKFVTGQNIQIVIGEKLNEYVAQFVIPLLKAQMRAKFNWGGNGATLGRMKTLKLMLPVNDEGQPDFDYMEQYSKNMMLRKYKQYLAFIDRKTQDIATD